MQQPWQPLQACGLPIVALAGLREFCLGLGGRSALPEMELGTFICGMVGIAATSNGLFAALARGLAIAVTTIAQTPVPLCCCLGWGINFLM